MLNIGTTTTESDSDDDRSSSVGSAAVPNKQSTAVSDRTSSSADCFGCLHGTATHAHRNNRAHPSNSSSSTVSVVTDQPSAGKRGRFDIDAYATKKSAASGLMDIALLMANASQLKHVLQNGSGYYFYWPMLVLLVASIILQLGIGIALLALSKTKIYQADENDVDEQKLDIIEARNRRAESINNAVLAAILLLTFINTFISAFGLDSTRTK